MLTLRQGSRRVGRAPDKQPEQRTPNTIYTAAYDGRYDSFSVATAELVQGRIWAGVHYRTAAVDGDRLGAVVSREVLSQAFGPAGSRWLTGQAHR